jgi:dTDP-4-dehydrorhamnose 3,5-epimerase
MIAGVLITPLRQIIDDRGKIMHMLRADSPGFQQFGEIYFSFINPGAVKAWKLHRRMTLNYAVPHGLVRMVIYDDRPESPTRGEVQELLLGEDNYCLVTVPPMIWNGFEGLSEGAAIVANCATLPHDANEVERRTESDPGIPYSWSRQASL